MGRCVDRVAGPVGDGPDRLAQALYLLLPPPVVPCSGTAEIPLEQFPELNEAGRAEHGDKEALDLALAARGAAVLLPVEDARLGADHNVQPAGPVSHAIWVKQDVSSTRHGGSLPVRPMPAQSAFPPAASGGQGGAHGALARGLARCGLLILVRVRQIVEDHRVELLKPFGGVGQVVLVGSGGLAEPVACLILAPSFQ